MPGGRPSIYSPELAEKILAQLAVGKSLRTICKQKGIPSVQTVLKWRRTIPEFAEQYELAREDRAEYLMEELFDIVDNENPEDTQRARLRADVRKWAMSKFAPKRYQDKLDTNVTGNITYIVDTGVPPRDNPLEEIPDDEDD